MADGVRVDLDFSAVTFDNDGVVAQQTAGVAMHALVAGMENTLQATTRLQWVENPRQRVNRRAQAQCIAQVDHALELRRPVRQRYERQIALRKGGLDLRPV